MSETKLVIKIKATSVLPKMKIGIKPVIISESKMKIIIKSVEMKFKKLNFTGTLKDYQEKIYNDRMYEIECGILSLDMGMGKTILQIKYICESAINQWVIVLPMPLAIQWYDAFMNFTDCTPSDVIIYHGTQRKWMDLSKYKIVITTYETVVNDLSNESSVLYKYHLRFNGIVLDEAHRIRNEGIKTNQMCNKLAENCTARWSLSGTIMMNAFKDLESNALFINAKDINFRSNLAAWKDKYYIRKTKAEVEMGLKRKHIYTHELESDDDHWESYMEMFVEAKELYDKYLKEPTRQNFNFLLKKILRMRQCCNHPDASLSKDEYDIEDNRYQAETQTVKFLKTLEIITQSPREDKIVIFSQWTHTLDLLANYLKENGIECLQYTGKMNMSLKNSITHQFKTTSAKVLLISLHAGGVGLNLTAANHVIMFDSWWNGSMEDQAIDRVYRLGQTKEVFVHRLNIKGSIECWMSEMKNEKGMVQYKFDTESDAYYIDKEKLKSLLHKHV